jgi:hypothetical protein
MVFITASPAWSIQSARPKEWGCPALLTRQRSCVVSSTPDNDRMPRDYRAMNHRGTAYSDTTGPVHSGSTDGGVCFRSSQGDDAAQQQQRDNHGLHWLSSWGFHRVPMTSRERRRHVDPTTHLCSGFDRSTWTAGTVRPQSRRALPRSGWKPIGSQARSQKLATASVLPRSQSLRPKRNRPYQQGNLTTVARLMVTSVPATMKKIVAAVR